MDRPDREGAKGPHAFVRKLAAILSADVEGYSRLMGEDEEATVSVLTVYRQEIGKLVERHGGRVVDSPGDNLLAEFPSALAAVRCSVDIQGELERRNSQFPSQRRMRFRIGVNLGEVIQEGGRIYGDGVNVAARIQELAPPGGVCISRSVHEQVENKLGFDCVELGDYRVKNMKKPVRVYRVVEPRVAEATEQGPRPRARSLWAMVLFASVLGLISAGALLFFAHRHPALPPQQGLPSPLPISSAAPSPKLAVMPFINMSGDPELEHLGDGIAEDIITALASLPRLSVVSRTTIFTYKGKPVRAEELGKELGITYILEGSIQGEGNRLRVTVQLVDAPTGFHLWADRYDLQMADAFALRDDITLRVLKALQVQIGEKEGFPVKPKQTESLEAYLRFLRGRSYASHFTREKNALARQTFTEAIGLDPKFLEAYLALAHTYLTDWWIFSGETSGDILLKASELAARALEINPADVNAVGIQAYVYSLMGKRDQALEMARDSAGMAPDSPEAIAWLGVVQYHTGLLEDSIATIERAVRSSKMPPAWYLYHLGYANLMAHRYEEAISAFQKALQKSERNPWALFGMVAAQALAGREEEAGITASRVLGSYPGFSSAGWAAKLPFLDPSERPLLVERLHRAGLP